MDEFDAQGTVAVKTEVHVPTIASVRYGENALNRGRANTSVATEVEDPSEPIPVWPTTG